MKKLFPQIISEALENHSKTQEQFARDVGVSLATVSRWINGRKQPRSHVILAKIQEVIHAYEEEKDQELTGKPAA